MASIASPAILKSYRKPDRHRSGIVATPSHAIRRHMQHDATLHTHSQRHSQTMTQASHDTQPATQLQHST